MTLTSFIEAIRWTVEWLVYSYNGFVVLKYIGLGSKINMQL